MKKVRGKTKFLIEPYKAYGVRKYWVLSQDLEQFLRKVYCSCKEGRNVVLTKKFTTRVHPFL